MRTALMLAALLLIAGCPRGPSGSDNAENGPTPADAPPAEPLIVWADPLLKAPLAVLAERFAEQYPPGIRSLFVERGSLLERMTQAEPPPLPHLFLIADAEVLSVLREHQRIDEETARTFAGDRLVLVQRVGDGFGTKTLFDIYQLRFKALGIGDANTAVGHYAEQALISDGVMDRVEDRLRRLTSTSEIPEALASEGVDMAITTASAIAGGVGLETVLLIGADLHDPIRYQAVAAAGRGAADAVQSFLRMIAEDEDAQALLPGYGLLDRETAMKGSF